MLLNILDLYGVFLFQEVTSTSGKGILKSNIALNKPANQRSTKYFAHAYYAVDGGVNNTFSGQSCTHTANDLFSYVWWEVDLRDQFKIGAVHILNRNSCIHRLHDVRVDVYEDKAKPRKEKHCITHPGPAGPGWLNLSCKVPVLGRYVRITKPQKDRHDVLTLCEVEIYQAKEYVRPMSYLNCCKICG